MTLATELLNIGVVPVIALPDTGLALDLAQALMDGGLACAEVTFRTDAAAAALPLIRDRFPGLLLGAGTVLTIRQADVAIDAGAQFIVAPGFSPAIVDHVLGRGVPMIPGIATPSDIQIALTHDVELLKFFPAEQFGGAGTIKAFAGPYPQVHFIPTGGITPANLRLYLALPQVVACGGSWMVKSELLEARDFAAVTRLAREAVAIVAEVRGDRDTQARME
jgi:2-dehydro-3-deoxyphosphogluconate aldolase/(4S)-4-hydroxy-2-oxoglutarate aldolase